jgi:hypothetical protein
LTITARGIVVRAGYSAAFLALGAIAACGFLLYFFGMPETFELDKAKPMKVPAAVVSQ